MSAKGPSSNESSEITEQPVKLSLDTNGKINSQIYEGHFDLKQSVDMAHKKRYSTGYIKHKPSKAAQR